MSWLTEPVNLPNRFSFEAITELRTSTGIVRREGALIVTFSEAAKPIISIENVTLNVEHVLWASPIAPDAEGMYYKYYGPRSDFVPGTIPAGRDHLFAVVPHEARTMIALVDGPHVCIRDDLEAIIASFPSNPQSGVTGLLHKVSAVIDMEIPVTRDELQAGWSNWRLPKLES